MKVQDAQKQFSLSVRLGKLGKVFQLEQNSVGVENIFLVVFSGRQHLEISGDTTDSPLPERNFTNHMKEI